MLLQIDGSPHDWLSGRGPRITLIGAIDDATGKIIRAVFRPTEDQEGYLILMRSIALEHGLPESFHHGRHTILRSPKEATIEDELAGREPMSQLQRVMADLGIGSIPAHSPQAKGRIERLWKTLQDRLTREMTLSGVSSIDEANAFLPRYIERFNHRFGRKPREAEAAWVGLEADTDIYSGKHRLAYREAALSRLAAKQVVKLPNQPKPLDPKAAARRRAWLFQPNAGVPGGGGRRC